MINAGSNRYFSPGFTLVEVLISLSLLVIVLGSIYSTFFTVQRATERFEDVPLKYHETRTALDIIRREIESSFISIPDDPDRADREITFEIKDRDILGKDASQISFSGFSLKKKGVNRVSYFIKEEDGSLVLLKSEKSSSESADEYKVEMISDIESFSVETLFNNTWVKTWHSSETGKLPEVVKVHIEIEDNGKIVRLSEYARPRTGVYL